MTRYVALLRGINVGGHRKVPMADLRRVLGGIGYDAVRTHLQSGNAVFDTDERPTGEVAAAIEAALLAEFGFAVDVVVRTGEQLRAVVAANPLDVEDPARFAVAFLAAAPDRAALAAITPESYTPDLMRVGEHELYMHFPNGLGKARLTPVLTRHLGSGFTVRNWNTVTRLMAMVDS